MKNSINLKLPSRKENSNKGTFGKVLNVSGSDNYIGAAYLSSLAAYKAGAGYVALASSEKVTNSVSKMLPEAVFLTRASALKNLKNYTVMLIGCGFGQSKESEKDLVKFLFDKNIKNIPTIIDADGLNIIAKLQITNLPCNTIITPHPAEAARLLGISIDDVIEDTANSAKKLTDKYNCITVLKTHRTIVYSKENEVYINEHGNSALAKAGTGDVLAGIIAGLTAQKNDGYEMAKLGVYLHSIAGELASHDLTEYSVLASDVIKYLPEAMKSIL